MAKKIQYGNKAPYQTLPDIPDKNKTTAEDLNEIKEVVNNNATELDEAKNKVDELDEKMDIVVAPALVYKGSVNNYSDLANIQDVKKGDIYSVSSENKNYIYSDNSWIEYTPQIDLSEINEQIKNIIDTLPSTIANAILEDNKKRYPIGKILLSEVGTNPATYLGFGTWELWGAGRIPVGINIEDEDFNLAGKTGGEKEHTLTVNEMPSHNHGFYFDDENGTAGQKDVFTYKGYLKSRIIDTAIATSGRNKAHNNMPPYITCYMWKRTE
nr:MAG TPA: Baseplate structural protein [Bacteriophage sp.]